MKQAAMIGAVLAVATWSFAQSNSKPTTQSQPPAQATSPAAGATSSKRPPQAKTQPEYEAYKTAIALTDAAAAEKAADDFATKFPDSELRIMLYKSTMRLYQRAGNSDKIVEMGRKGLALDTDDPELLVTVASELAEKTHDTDLDKDQRLDEARKSAERALQTIDTDIVFPAGTPPDKADAYKNLLRSSIYSILGTLEFNKNNFMAAETDFRKSIDAYPQQPDPVTVLRLSLALDRQNKYPEALNYANKAVELTPDGSGAHTLAIRERDRLVQLTGGKPPAPSTGTANPPQSTTVPH